MKRCFVMQPFDGGPFDKRYEDVYAPAIVAAGLEPYRVDRDPSASIPIERIVQGIRESSVCFADISVDNPNVWFELDYALASRREVVLVSSVDRARYPFDVQHRNVIRYATESTRDFAKLQGQITERLKAALQQQLGLETIEELAPVRSKAGLSPHEQVFLVLVAQRMDSPLESVSSYLIRGDMENSGFTELATVLSGRSLVKRGFVDAGLESDHNGNEFTAYRVLDAGFEWLDDNQGQLELRREARRPSSTRAGSTAKDDLDDLPF